MAQPASLSRDISPPPSRKASSTHAVTPADASADVREQVGAKTRFAQGVTSEPTLAAIEAGQAKICDHLEYFTKHLREASRPTHDPRIGIQEYQALYKRNQHKHGRHFVIHQHDHPIAGVHYDLRLQFSDSSTVSFAVPYGLPGNPNSVRPNRMAIETRVHNLWNNLIESASHATGSLLVWDTGEYEILPWKEDIKRMTDDELSDAEPSNQSDCRSHSERLSMAFRGRHIRLRLHGTRLPRGYTVSLRLPFANDYSDRPKRPIRKRRRFDPPGAADVSTAASNNVPESGPLYPEQVMDVDLEDDAAGMASDDDEDATIRAGNAYTGATNSIGSIHQRHWFLTLDRRSSGFHKACNGHEQGQWVGSWEPFFVHGRDHERSVVTGRSADEVMEDEGIEKFVGRKMWRPILE